MDYQLAVLFLLFPVAFVAFHFGRLSKEYPPEEEMIKRIVDSRVEKGKREKIEAELATEFNRRAAS